jgi:hypothetical protein
LDQGFFLLSFASPESNLKSIYQLAFLYVFVKRQNVEQDNVEVELEEAVSAGAVHCGGPVCTGSWLLRSWMAALEGPPR